MSVGTILLILLVLALFGAFPRTGAYNAGWGYFPVGGLGLVLIVLLVLVFSGRL